MEQHIMQSAANDTVVCVHQLVQTITVGVVILMWICYKYCIYAVEFWLDSW